MQNITEKQVRAKVARMKKFYTHSFIFFIGIVVYLAKTYFGVPLNFWPIKYLNCFVMGIWALIYFIDIVKFIILENVLGSHWEQKKINQFLNQNKNRKYE